MINFTTFEDYDGQDTTGYDYIGVVGQEPERITDVDAQVAEFERKYGNRTIRLYASEGAVV